MIILPSSQKNQREVVEEADFLASASDLMIGLLFVFIIMVVMLSQRVDSIQSNESQNDPLASAVLIIGQKFKDAGLDVVIDPQSGVIGLPADALFGFNSAVLNESSITTLNKARNSLNTILPCYIHSERGNRPFNCPKNDEGAEIETIFIEGHTDSKPLQQGNYTNWHLGLDRARAVYDVLTEGKPQFYQNERKLDVFGISSYADKRLIKTAGIEDAGKSRRVELRFILAFQPDSTNAKVSKEASSKINRISQ
jgi:chemotaxis protein MotB|uniref:OmpA/MotB family protein n=1 Tax=Polynucleobacter sp. TaxID=2029855 RepID=UPI0040481B5B